MNRFHADGSEIFGARPHDEQQLIEQNRTASTLTKDELDMLMLAHRPNRRTNAVDLPADIERRRDDRRASDRRVRDRRKWQTPGILFTRGNSMSDNLISWQCTNQREADRRQHQRRA